jgi:integrase
MQAKRKAGDPYKRHSTRTPGVTYRERADGTRTYSVRHQGRHVGALRTEQEAKALQAELLHKKSRGERVVLPSKVTVSEVAEEWWRVEAQPGLRPQTLGDYRRNLDKVILPRFGARPIGQVRKADILELVNELRGAGDSESTVANKLKPLRGMLEFAHSTLELIPANPFRQFPRGKLPSCQTTRAYREWTTEEVEWLVSVAHARDSRREARADYGLAIETKLRTGLRLGELLGVRYQDLDTRETASGGRATFLRVERQWTKDGRVAEPKTKAAVREVPVPASVSAKIAARKLRLGASGSDFLFASERGGSPPSHTNFRRRGWNPAVRDAGLCKDGEPNVSPHSARHAFASQLADLGLSSTDLAKALGHTSASITEAIYINAFNEDARKERLLQAMELAAGGAS